MKYTISTILMGVVTACGHGETNVTFSDEQIVKHEGQKIFFELKEKGITFEDGPCLIESMLESWSVDIRYIPEREVDTKEENQCQNYISGATSNLIILDQNGIYIETQNREQSGE